MPNINHSFQCADGLFQKAGMGIDLKMKYDGYGNGKGTIFDCGLCLNSPKNADELIKSEGWFD